MVPFLVQALWPWRHHLTKLALLQKRFLTQKFFFIRLQEKTRWTLLPPIFPNTRYPSTTAELATGLGKIQDTSIPSAFRAHFWKVFPGALMLTYIKTLPICLRRL